MAGRKPFPLVYNCMLCGIKVKVFAIAMWISYWLGNELVIENMQGWEIPFI
jgi:hypothetical protein